MLRWEFISKKLNKTELGWNIVEKEMYSIFYSIMKLDHLLRDQYFILQTDSKILSHMNTDHKDKVGKDHPDYTPPKRSRRQQS